MKRYEHLLHPTYAQFIEDGNPERALSSAQKVLAASEADTELHPFAKAEALNEGWFQIALIHQIMGHEDLASEAAKTAYMHDSWMFNQHVTIAELLLQKGEESFDKLVAELYEWHYQAHSVYFENPMSLDQLAELVPPYSERSSAIRWATDDVAFFKELMRRNQEDESLEPLLDIIEHWRSEGRDPNQCDAVKGNILYFLDKEDEMLKLWEGRSIGEIPYIMAYQRIACQRIEEGELLPDPIPLIDCNDPQKWWNITDSVMDIILPYIFGGFTEEKQEELGEEKTQKIKQLITLAETFCERGLEVYHNFLLGEQNRHATAPAILGRLHHFRGMLYEYTGQHKEALEEYDRGMQSSPFLALARSLMSLALDYGHQDAYHALQWIEDHASENFSLAEHYANDRLKLWAIALFDSVPKFLEAVDSFNEKYEPVHRLYRGFHFNMTPLIPGHLVDLTQECAYARNNIWEGLSRLIQVEPDHPELLAHIFSNRYYIWDNDEKELFQTYLPKLQIIRDHSDPDVKEERDRLFRALSGAGYLLGTIEVDELPEEERIKQGIELLDEALKLGYDDPLLLAQTNLDKGILYRMLDDYHSAIDAFSKAIDLLEPDHRYPEDARNTRTIPSFKISEIPSILIMLAYYYRGLAREEVGAPREEFIADYRETFLLNPFKAVIWAKLANHLFEDASSDDDVYNEVLVHAQNYVDCYSDEPEDEERCKLLTVLIDLHLQKGRTRRAERLLMELEMHDPENDEIEQLKQKLKNTVESIDPEQAQKAETRKQNSIQKLKSENIPVNENLPCIETADVVRVRTEYELVYRLVCAVITIHFFKDIVAGEDPESVQKAYHLILERFGLNESHMTPKEKYVLSGNELSETNLLEMEWLIEQCYPLFWAVNLIDELGTPTERCDSDALLKVILSKDSMNQLLNETHLRDIDEILDQADLFYRYKWACSDAMHHQKELPGDLDFNLVRSRTAGLNWIIDADGNNDWDYIDTST